MNWGNASIVVGFGFGMVLFILFILVFLLSLWDKILSVSIRIKQNNSGKAVDKLVEQHEVIRDLSGGEDGETIAAIATALYFYFQEVHDEESNVVTIKRTERSYSPWNSKIYGMNSLNK